MKKQSAIFVLFLVGVLTLSLRLPMPVKTYSIEDHSRLFIEGSSNVNEFTCQCNQSFPRSTVRFESDRGGQSLHFENALLTLQTKRLDCGHKGINRDLQKALQADTHPHIKIQLLSAKQKGSKLISECDGWVPLDASASLSIAGVSRDVHLAIKGLRLSDNRYQFKSEKTVRMSDFGIDPPKPLFGLIKVDDEIAINFDLVVQIEEGV